MEKSLSEFLSEVRRAIPGGAEAVRSNRTAAISDAVDLTNYRPISAPEVAVVTALLELGSSLDFLPQLQSMLVSENCTCGCPSISFAPARDELRIDVWHQNIVAEATGEASDGLVGLILWQAGGKLTGLEVYDLAGRELTGRENPFGLPSVASIRPF